MKFKYFLTFHAVERLQQRFVKITNQNEKIKNWNRAYREIDSVKPVFDQLISDSVENKTFINNTRYMTHIYEKYGFDNEYKFLENQEHGILFVMKKPRGNNDFTLVTLMPTEYKHTNALNTVKYNDKKKKSEIKKNSFLNLYNQVKKTIYPFENEDLNVFLRIRNLEEYSNFEIFHNQTLLNILNVLDKKNLYEGNSSNRRVFMSENRIYTYKKSGNDINLISIGENTLKDKVKRMEDFNLMIEIDRSFNQSKVVNKITEDITRREIIIGENKHLFDYNEKDNLIVNYNVVNEIHEMQNIKKESKKEDLFEHALKNNFEQKIQEKVNKTQFIILSKVDYKNVLCKTQIEDKEVIFKYSIFDKKIKINEIKNLFQNEQHFKYMNSELKKLVKTKNGDFPVVQDLAWNKKIKKAIMFNQEIEFIHIKDQSELTILSIKDCQLLNHKTSFTKKSI